MFANAVEIASGYTFPYIGLRRRADGSVFTIVASFVIMNAEGWVLTSAHIVEEMLAARRSADAAADATEAQTPESITDRAEIWAINTDARPQLVGGRIHRAADVAIGRLEPFDVSWVAGQPTLRDTAKAPLRQGESACRLGFPFHSVAASWDEEAAQFQLPDTAFPVPRFVLDGIVSRFNRRIAADGSEATFVETSSPGLRGQSGGPLLDTAGRIMGIQSQTAHLDLGFDARFTTTEGEPVVERQFLNVGLATHVDDVRALLDIEHAGYLLG